MSPPIEVSTDAVHRAADGLRATATAVGGDLTASYHHAAPDCSANPDWATTRALDEVVAAVDAALDAAARQARDAADRLQGAAAGYDDADRRAGDRLRW
jgi:hypothetical protein